MFLEKAKYIRVKELKSRTTHKFIIQYKYHWWNRWRHIKNWADQIIEFKSMVEVHSYIDDEITTVQYHTIKPPPCLRKV